MLRSMAHKSKPAARNVRVCAWAGHDPLMRRYHDRPMDFADATLVHIAEREAVSTIFTVDHDDFETYRIRGCKRFRILPGR